MVKLNKITTKTGDDGTTGLGGGSRLSKAHPRIRAIGAIDEANAAIGLARFHAEGKDKPVLAQIQNGMFDLGSDLASPPDRISRITDGKIMALEQKTQELNENLKTLKSFILPGGSSLSAYLHLARTIIRRAECEIVELSEIKDEHVSPQTIKYINRLSDLLFVMARCANANGNEDILWEPG